MTLVLTLTVIWASWGLIPRQSETSKLILKYFGTEPPGFCAPGGFDRGLWEHPKQLGIIWNRGHRFIRTDGVGQLEQPIYSGSFYSALL